MTNTRQPLGSGFASSLMGTPGNSRAGSRCVERICGGPGLWSRCSFPAWGRVFHRSAVPSSGEEVELARPGGDLLRRLAVAGLRVGVGPVLEEHFDQVRL